MACIGCNREYGEKFESPRMLRYRKCARAPSQSSDQHLKDAVGRSPMGIDLDNMQQPLAIP